MNYKLLVILGLVLLLATSESLQNVFSRQIAIENDKNPSILVNILYALILFGIFLLLMGIFKGNKHEKFFFEVSPDKFCPKKDDDDN